MSNVSESVNLSGVTCVSCKSSIPAGGRGLVLTATVAYCRPCWLGLVQPVKPTSLERRAGRNWPRVGRCRLSA
jgi:hypothetical protein